MTIDRGLVRSVELSALTPPLREITTRSGEGLEFKLRHAFQTESAKVPGYFFDVSTTDGTPVGTATVLVTKSLADIQRIGHIGTEVLPALRKQGYALRMGRVLLAFLRELGIKEVLLTCDVGHESQVKAFREVGGVELDVFPPTEPGQPEKARFLVRL